MHKKEFKELLQKGILSYVNLIVFLTRLAEKGKPNGKYPDDCIVSRNLCSMSTLFQ